MKAETLRLSSALDESGAMEIARVLNTLSGVSKVAIATATGAIDVSYDENLTSMQEVRAVLQKAGLAAKRSEHGEEGMCCGSCGG
ncbi:MAG TPA: hypothetical protein DHV59_13640 [Oxalobacteraceae bacterium]|nr:hypothetical protein [Oxalobacteraceae bacterium]